MCIAAWGLGRWGRWWMDCPYHSKPRIQGTMEAKGMTVPLTTYNLTAIQILISDNICFICQKIKNPNYQGKWKAPMIDNPGMFPWNWTLYLLLFGCWVISTESNSFASQISRTIHTFTHLTAWSTLALSCGRLVLDSRIFLSLVQDITDG